MIKRCVICHTEYSGFGNNSEPVCEGLCCDLCNQRIVLPKRLTFFQIDRPVSPDPVWLYKQRNLLSKQFGDIEEHLDKLDNPCSCGNPSTVWLRTVNYPDDQMFIRSRGGEWKLTKELGGGDGEYDYGIYFCEKCYKEWRGD